MDQKNILCFGDSNTHGYNSKTGGRFTVEERWTKLLQRIWFLNHFFILSAAIYL